MPFFKIETNQTLNDADAKSTIGKASVFISEMLGKPEKYVMICLESDKHMIFGGDAQATAYIQLKSIGMPTERCAEFSSRICQFLKDHLDIKPDRIFIDFEDLQGNMFGWNETTF